MKYIGEYRELLKKEGFPSVVDNISTNEIPQKKKILLYLQNDKFLKGAMPYISTDVFSQEKIKTPALYYEDGVFCWDFETIYYFEKYNMVLPQSFIDYVLKK